MATFKNKNFTKRNYECTNIVACVTLTAEARPHRGDWEACGDDILAGLTQIERIGDVRYYGHL